MNGQNALDFFNSRLANKEPVEGNWQDVFVVADWSGGQTFDNYNGLLTGSLGVLASSETLEREVMGFTCQRLGGICFGSTHSCMTDLRLCRLAAPFLVNIIADKPAIVAGSSIGNDRNSSAPKNDAIGKERSAKYRL